MRRGGLLECPARESVPSKYLQLFLLPEPQVDNSHDKSFSTTFMIVFGGLVALFFGAIGLANWLGGGTEAKAGSKAIVALVDERTAPVAKVVTDPSLLVKVSTAAAHAPLTGDQVVAQTCSACHGAGVLGAPKIGDKAAWGPRKSAAGGLDGLVSHALAGKNAMPPRGGNADLSDAEVKAAVESMLKQAGV